METLSPADFDGRRLSRPGTWVVAFLADWCPFCVRFQPEFEPIDGTGPFSVAVADVSSEESPLWDDLGIEVVPALVVFRDGQVVYGVQSDPGVGLPPGALARARAVASSVAPG
jgi:thioredoxin